jgi:ATP-dependent helicase/nuclease subunit B
MQPRIYTIPPGQPFLDTLARALLSGDLPQPGGAAPAPLELARYTLLLPTRRAARAVQSSFLKATQGRASLLPQIRPIAEHDDDLDLLSGLAGSTAGAGDLPPAVSELERRLVLTVLVQHWANTMSSPSKTEAGTTETVRGVRARTAAQAAQLAAGLAALMDEAETQNIDLNGLAELVPDALSEHWQDTLQFLQIVTETWPAYLAEQSLTGPAERRNLVIATEAARLRANPPDTPVIIAGVTGSIPATAELMQVVAHLPRGALVLPGLDTDLDDESWQAITPDHPEHPQFGLKTLLDLIGIERRHVRTLPGLALPAQLQVRAQIFSEVMRPASTTDKWQAFAGRVDREEVAAALDGVTVLEMPSAQDEAEAIALILRNAVETPGRTAALVSPDRLLARRVAARLEVWGLRVDDSAGRPLVKTPTGAFLDLVLETTRSNFAPTALMALLRHPFCNLGLSRRQLGFAARALEIIAFRAPYLGSGLDGIQAAIEKADTDLASGQRRQRALRGLTPDNWVGARDLVMRLGSAFQPWTDLSDVQEVHQLRALVAVHTACAEKLATNEEGAFDALWQGEGGDAAALFMVALIEETAAPQPALSTEDYPDLFRTLAASIAVRPSIPTHPRIFIWGPFEARLQSTDVICLGSLNDGTWPAAADPGPWLNRPMRAELGLPQPETANGYAAHDVTQLLGAPRVYLTRAAKIDGVPTVPSRWLMRLTALLDGCKMPDVLAPSPDYPWADWARARVHVDQRQTLSPPAPRPPVAQRPRRISVSDVERWIANPYAIFAKHVLKLDALPSLGSLPGPAERGQVIHAALKRFADAHPDDLPPNIVDALMSHADDVLHDYLASPRVSAFWRPRFKRFAQWFAQTEHDRRAAITRIGSEVSGELEFASPAGPFKLVARADRIDLREDGHLIITDYKTGTPPRNAAVRSGAAPQLPLEAAIAVAGGFEGFAAASVADLRYIAATGGLVPGNEQSVANDDAGALAANSVEKLQRYIEEFDQPETPYLVLRRSAFNYDYDDYAHLARVAEWSALTESGE